MKTVVKILGSSIAVLLIGLSVAYYNTSSLGYDNANIFSYDENGIYIMDISINYKEIQEKIENIENYLPEKYITI